MIFIFLIALLSFSHPAFSADDPRMIKLLADTCEQSFISSAEGADIDMKELQKTCLCQAQTVARKISLPNTQKWEESQWDQFGTKFANNSKDTEYIWQAIETPEPQCDNPKIH